MLNIFSHKGNANQNYIVIPSHPSQNGNQEKQQMLEKIWGEKKSSYMIGGNVN
jgi:hypothetical protein